MRSCELVLSPEMQDLGKVPNMPVVPPFRSLALANRHALCNVRYPVEGLPRFRNGSRMSYIDEKKVNAAIRTCLHRCFGTSHSLAQMAGYLGELRAAGGWREAEIHAVERAVIKVLNGVAEGVIYPDDATNQPLGDFRRDDCGSARLSGA